MPLHMQKFTRALTVLDTCIVLHTGYIYIYICALYFKFFTCFFQVVKLKQVEHTLNEKKILAAINFPFVVNLEFHFKVSACEGSYSVLFLEYVECCVTFLIPMRISGPVCVIGSDVNLLLLINVCCMLFFCLGRRFEYLKRFEGNDDRVGIFLVHIVQHACSHVHVHVYVM